MRMPTVPIENTSTTPKPTMPHSTTRSLFENCACSSSALDGSTRLVHRMTFETSRVAWYILNPSPAVRNTATMTIVAV